MHFRVACQTTYMEIVTFSTIYSKSGSFHLNASSANHTLTLSRTYLFSRLWRCCRNENSCSLWSGPAYEGSRDKRKQLWCRAKPTYTSWQAIPYWCTLHDKPYPTGVSYRELLHLPCSWVPLTHGTQKKNSVNCFVRNLSIIAPNPIKGHFMVRVIFQMLGNLNHEKKNPLTTLVPKRIYRKI